MTETDLYISERLRALLPVQSDEQRAGLKEQIIKAGKVRDKIVYWHDGERNVIVDGMTRWDILLETPVPYDTEEMHFADYEEAELWMLENQLCRRNVTDLASLRKLRGEIYNRLKAKHGGDRKSKESRGQIGHLIEEAEKVAEKVGSSTRTMRRDGARVEAVAKLTKAAQVIAGKATDAELKVIGKLTPGDQDAVARAVRTGQNTVKQALKGVKPPASSKKDLGKCPNCLGTKWTEDDNGIVCVKCLQPHGEPAGDVDDKQLATQRSKTVKTAEALMRAFDDLQGMLAKAYHEATIDACKSLMKTAKSWK